MPQKPLTKAEIAKQIAPNFDVAKNYKRLVQCYGTAAVSYTHLDVYKRQGLKKRAPSKWSLSGPE